MNIHISHIPATCPTNPTLLDFSIQLYLVRSVNFEAPHYSAFSWVLLLHPPSLQMVTLATCSQTQSVYASFPPWQGPSITSIQNNRQNYNCVYSNFYILRQCAKACYHLVQNLLSSRLLSKNVKKTIILPVVLYGCETWSLTVREEHKLRVFENIWTKEG
jgi:hypothetical protein